MQVCLVALHPVAVAGHEIQLADGYQAPLQMDHSYARVEVALQASFDDEASRGQLFVIAQYSDGSYRDVTAEASVESLDEDVAIVSQGPAGINLTVRTGCTACCAAAHSYMSAQLNTVPCCRLALSVPQRRAQISSARVTLRAG